ncbi:Uncharacterised protein [Serratia fonticola]|uniref:Uncharacterized protein n=1 Tax=Serratia fonticola TaxID=47917 RepID=A0A4U9WEU4_SERFO|nr:Uncharacterised protein [Serratia fonticola]VTR57549.1 Uncharacterised protein [Serratia fonticola]
MIYGTRVYAHIYTIVPINFNEFIFDISFKW